MSSSAFKNEWKKTFIFLKLNGDNWNWLYFVFSSILIGFDWKNFFFFLSPSGGDICIVGVCVCVLTTFYMFWMSWRVASISSWSILFFARSFNNSSVRCFVKVSKAQIDWSLVGGYYNIKSKTHQNQRRFQQNHKKKKKNQKISKHQIKLKLILQVFSCLETVKVYFKTFLWMFLWGWEDYLRVYVAGSCFSWKTFDSLSTRLRNFTLIKSLRVT